MTQQYLNPNINDQGSLLEFANTVAAPDLELAGSGNQLVLIDPTAAACQVTLPGSESAGAGAQVTVVNVNGANDVTFAAIAGDAIANPVALNPLTLALGNQAYTFISDGAGNWVVSGANF